MAQYISVKRKQQTNKRAPLAITLCLLLLFSSFLIPSVSFAESSGSWSQVPYSTSNSRTDIQENGVTVTVGASNADIIEKAVVYGHDVDVYLTYVYNDSSHSSSTAYFFSLTDYNDSSLSWNIYYNVSSTTRVYTYANSNFSTVEGEDTVYYKYGGAINPSDWTIQGTPFDSLSDALTSFRNGGYNSGGGGGITNNGNAIIVVNPGNVAYIGYDSATFNFLINLSNPVSSLNSNARYGFASELPNGVLTFTPSSGNALPLRKSVSDLLGRSATWVGSVDTDTVGYFIVYNPVYDLNGNTNPPIRVTVTVGYINVTQFPLTASDVGGDIISTGNSDNFYISDGVQGGTDLPSYIYSQTDQNGNVTTSSALTVPVTPYNYTTQSAGSAESGLQGFIQQILDLLSAPIKLIQNLYDSAVGFFNYLSSLWSWLPPELTTIIISALGVLVVIGVVKFLWK